MAVTPELKTLLIYNEVDLSTLHIVDGVKTHTIKESHRAVVDYLNDNELREYEILEVVEDRCPVHPSLEMHVSRKEKGFSVEVYDRGDTSFPPKPIKKLMVEQHTVWEIYGKTFKAEEV